MTVSYEKTAWKNNSAPYLNETNLNNIEEGIEACANEINTHVADTDSHFSASERTKLSGIEEGATADQTKADIDALGIDADTLDTKHYSDISSEIDSDIATHASDPVAHHSNANDPTADEKAALAGTGTPSGINRYVTNDDSRLSDARTPVSHSHEVADITDFEENVQDIVSSLVVAGANVSAEYNDDEGTLTISATDTQLSTEQVQDIVGGLLVAGTGISISYDDEAGTLTITLAAHTHAISDVTGLQDSLDTKATVSDLSSHTSNESNPHSVTKSQVGLENVDNVQQIPLSQKGVANGVAELDSNAKVPSSQLPAIALTDVFEVASEAEQLALDAEQGDVAVRTDENKSYCHNGGTAGTMADWTLLKTPTDAVLSVFGRTGAVTAESGDYSLDDISESDTYKRYTALEKTKLAGIEEAADVTDAANVEAAGAVMTTGDQSVAGTKIFEDVVLETFEISDMEIAGNPTFVDLSSIGSRSISSQTGGDPVRSGCFSPDGTKFFISNYPSTKRIHRYDLSTPWMLSTATYVSSLTVSYSPRGFVMGTDGYHFYIGYGSYAYEYTMTTQWDITTASLTYTKSVTVNPVELNPTGTIILFSNLSSPFTISQYTMSTAWDLSTVTSTSKTLTINASFENMRFSPDGTQLMVILTTGVLRVYDLSTAYDISTSILNTTVNLNTLTGVTLTGFALDQTNMRYIYPFSYTYAYQYELTNQFVGTNVIQDGAVTADKLDVTLDDIPDGSTNVGYTVTEQTKLSGIETGATNHANYIAVEDDDAVAGIYNPCQTLFDVHIPAYVVYYNFFGSVLDGSYNPDSWYPINGNGSVSYSSRVLTYSTLTAVSAAARTVIDQETFSMNRNYLSVVCRIDSIATGEGGTRDTAIGFQPEFSSFYSTNRATFHQDSDGNWYCAYTGGETALTDLSIGRNLQAGDVVEVRLCRDPGETNINKICFYVNNAKQLEVGSDYLPTSDCYAGIGVYGDTSVTTARTLGISFFSFTMKF